MFSILSRSYKWKKVRLEHLKQEYCCQACGSYSNLHVHHIVPVGVDKSKEFEATNLITLCKSCHFVFGHLMDWKSWNKDVVDDCKVYYNKVINKPSNISGQFYENNMFINFVNNIYNYCFFWNNRS